MSKKDKKSPSKTIVLNRKAKHDYFFEEKYEAGLVLQGWEVKSLRAGRVQLKDSYVSFKHGEAWLVGVHMSPLSTTAAHLKADPERHRKLLLSRREINRLMGAVQREGYTAVPICLYWKRQHVKIEIALAKGKHHYDKRATEKKRDWERDKARIMRK